MYLIPKDSGQDTIPTYLTKIDGYQMVSDLYFLKGLEEFELPLQINRDWHPKIRTIYNQMLSGSISVDIAPRLSRTWYETDFYVYELEPIDDWEGYHHVFLEDLLQEIKWFNLIHRTFKILKENSNWEQDVISGPYISALPGTELAHCSWVMLLKQENNGDTFVVSRYPLNYLSDSLINCRALSRLV